MSIEGDLKMKDKKFHTLQAKLTLLVGMIVMISLIFFFGNFHLADVIGSIVCVPAAVLFFYGIDNRYSIKQYTIKGTIVYIAYEFLGLFHIHGTFDVYDIIAIIISSLLFYGICVWLRIVNTQK